MSGPTISEAECSECHGRGVILVPCYEDRDISHCECWGDGEPCCRCGDNTDVDYSCDCPAAFPERAVQA